MKSICCYFVSEFFFFQDMQISLQVSYDHSSYKDRLSNHISDNEIYVVIVTQISSLSPMLHQSLKETKYISSLRGLISSLCCQFPWP